MTRRCLCAMTLLTGAAFGQNTSRTFYFPHTDSPKTLQEQCNAIRSVTDTNATADPEKMAITVTGTAEQISIAAWVSNELDQPPAARQTLTRRDYPGTVGQNQLVRVYFPAYFATPQEFQEAVNLTRSIADIRWFLPVFGSGAIVARSEADLLDLGGWILGEIDQPADQMKPGGRDHAVRNVDPRSGNQAQLYVLTNIDTPQALQELVNGVRSLADIQRCFPFNARKVVAMRGSTDQIALADWLFQLLDQPAAGTALDAGTHEYRVNTTNPGDTASVARVFFLNHVDSAQRLQQIINEVRTASQIQRMYPNNQARAIALRGTGDQVARAEQMIKERDQ